MEIAIKPIVLRTRQGSTKIRIQRGILEKAQDAATLIGKRRFLIVSNRRVARLCGETLLEPLKHLSGYSGIFLIPDSEKAKDLSVAQTLYDKLISIGFTRSCLLVALGGGVCSDLTGFAAATFMRGLPWMAIPTTLLAQIDAAIGGKTAVNHPRGKNLIGTFWHPQEVLIDPKALATLPDKQMVNGLSEMIKYGMIAHPGILTAIERNLSSILAAEPKPLDDLIARCARIKAKVVQEDECDHGRRQILNFGHTLGHALETVGGYGKRLHGFSVAAGMLFAARLSRHLGCCDDSVVWRLEEILRRAGLYPKPIRAGHAALIRTMATDKKRRDGNAILFVLPVKIGKVVLVNVDMNVLAGETLWRFDCR